MDIRVDFTINREVNDMKDIKLGLKLITYGLQFKTMATMFAVFAGFGIILELFASETMGNMGGIYLVITGTYIFQSVITSSIATSIAASAAKRNLQTKLPVLFSSTLMLVFYTLFVVLRTVRLSLGTYDAETIKAGYVAFVSVALLGLMIQIYNGFAYKFYIPSLIIMLVVMIPLMVLGMRGEVLGGGIPFSNNWAYVILGYVLLIVGSLISYLITILLFKYEIDPKAYRSALTRAGR